LNQTVKGFIYIAIATCAFGTIPVVAKLAILSGGNETTTLLSRFAIVTIFFLIYMKWKGLSWRVERRQFYALLFLGFVAYSNVALLFFLAMRHITPAIGELILYTYPAMVAILAFFFLGEKLTRVKLLAICIAFIGCSLVLWAPVDKISLLGVVFAFLTGFAYAVYIVGNKKVLEGVHPVVATAYMGACCMIFFFVYGLITGTLDFYYNPQIIMVILIMAFWCTITGILCFFKGMMILGAVKASVISTFEPVFTIILSFILLGHGISLVQLVGGGLILSSVLVMQLGDRKTRLPALD